MLTQPKLLSYEKARWKIRDGDVLLFSPRIRRWAPRDWAAVLIAVGTCFLVPWIDKQKIQARWRWFVHAALAGWFAGRLMIVQETSGEDHIIGLSDQVRQWPGKIHVYRPRWRRKADNGDALSAMVRIVGRKYGWYTLCRVALYYIPGLRRCLAADEDDAEKSKFRPFCSMAVSQSLRTGAGLDPVPKKADRVTTPADLGGSRLLWYLFTLT